jgi:hypothetical protein
MTFLVFDQKVAVVAHETVGTAAPPLLENLSSQQLQEMLVISIIQKTILANVTTTNP